MLDDHTLAQLISDSRRFPLPALARRYNIDLVELTSELRRIGALEEIQPHELQFITENLDRMPAEAIRARLHLSASQFSQICQKKLGRSTQKSGGAISRDEAIAKTQWLITKRLELPVDDFLPRNISNRHFTQHGLYNCVSFAEKAKARDVLYRGFPAVAFLVCKAFPDMFRPFQFRHAKQNEYFTGKDGRVNVLNAVRWIIERKMGVQPAVVPTVLSAKGFLTDTDLQFYGVGAHWYRRHFKSKQSLLDAVAKAYGAEIDRGGTSAHLRSVLEKAGRPARTCEVDGCEFDDQFGLDIHHIVPRVVSRSRAIRVHDADNLVALCPNHHRMARRFDWQKCAEAPSGHWRSYVLTFLAAAPSNPPDQEVGSSKVAV